MERVYLQSGLEEFLFNPLRGKQIDYLYVYFKKSHDSLKNHVIKSIRGWSIYLPRTGLEEDSSKPG